MDIKKIVSEMTLEEKAQMCSGKDFWHLESVERLGIPSVMVTDGPCGIRKQSDKADHLGLNESVKAISYPTGSLVASSFDRELIKKLGEVLAEECQTEDIAVILGPAANIKRSPLCGRNFEYFSEDPYLTGEMSASYINGVQSKNVGVSLKHFALNNQETRRLTGSSNVDERTMREIYLAGFETAVKKSKPWTVMCSYNRINGEFSSDNKMLLTDILRDEWGFDGYVMTDWGAMNNRVKALKAGCDLEMPGDAPDNTKKILEAIKNGELSEKTLDTAVERILDKTLRYVENRKPGTVFDYEKDHQLAREAAAESMVLLKNEGGILPLCKKSKVAFIGSYAEKPRFQGGGSSHVNSYKVTNSLEAAEGIDYSYAPAYIRDKDEADEALLNEAVKTAAAAETAVVFLAVPDMLESEGFDRENLKLPENQTKVLEAVLKVQKNVVVVVENGGSIEMPWIDEVKAVLYAYLGGEAVGLAVNDILFGDVNPSGKLAETFPLRLEDNPSYLFYIGEEDQVDYREGVFVGYRYYDKKKMPVLFPFGYGLSYTSFDYSDIKLDKKEMKDTDTVTVSCKVKNSGKVFGKEAVQLYVVNAKGIAIRPVKELKGFEKVSLEPGEEKEISFTLDKRAFAYYNTDISDWVAESGEYSIEIGSSSRDIKLCDTVKIESTSNLRKPFSMISRIADVLADPKGAQIVGKLMAESPLGQMDGEALGTDMMKMLGDMPIRTMVTMGGGMLSETDALKLIEMLNS